MRFLELKGVNKSYGKVLALTNVNFHVDAAEVVGLIGDNGAGKSTLIKIVSGVVRPDSGEIRIGDVVVNDWSVPLARRHGIETVFQDQALAEQQTITRTSSWAGSAGDVSASSDKPKSSVRLRS